MSAFSSLCSKITTYFVQTLSIFFSMKTLRTIHKFCMVYLPYHNEDVKNFQRKLSLRSWLTEATKVPHF